jgi:prevent-host-death family protein
MKTIGSNELKTHLARILDETRSGEEFTVTKNGVPVARLLPVKKRNTAAFGRVVARVRKQRAGKRLKGLSVRDLIQEGRR